MKMMRLSICTAGWLLSAPIALSQTPANTPPAETEASADEDVIVVYGKQNWGRHDGMNAFFEGDFEKAEIEFEREFRGLKRRRSAIDNAGFLTEASQFQAEATGNATSSNVGIGGQGGNISQPQGSNRSASRASGSARSSDKKELGSSLLLDGKVTYQDFALTKYMAGLSEVKLGKIEEAKKSFKTSLTYDGNNYDARMRLGLIYLMESNFDDAANQLKKIDKLRRKCNKRKCDDAEYITRSAVTLSNAIIKEASAQ